jgi:pectate lyase
MKPTDRFTGPRRSILLERLEGRILFDAAPIPLVPLSADAQQPIVPSSPSDVGQTAEGTNPLAAATAAGQQDNDIAVVSGALETRTLAFPGAAGFGAYAQGGRGGDVYHVTNLLDHGPGSLREGIRSASGPRTIVFDISGTIHLESRLSIDQPYLTIAGQTAPGDGITLRNYGAAILDTHDIIVRYVRFRTGDTVAAEHDSLLIWNSHDIMIDHVSASWGVDEIIDTGSSRNVTIQWSMITEALHDSHHVKGPHSMGSIHYGGSVSLHHNLFAHNNARSPLVRQQADVVNNVIYDWGTHGTIVGWPDIGTDPLGPTQVNLQGNYYIAGPSTTPPALAALRHLSSQLWAADNLLDSNRNGLRDGQPLDTPRSTADTRFDFPPVEADDPLSAYQRVLNHAGASLVRDAVDHRIARDLIEETGRLINSQNQVGNWPQLESASAPSDRDLDGIPDAWEEASNHLDPDDPADSQRDVDGDGLTNLEEYLARRASGDSSLPAKDPSAEQPAKAPSAAQEENRPDVLPTATTVHQKVQPFGHPQYPPIVASAAFTYSGRQSTRDRSDWPPWSDSEMLSDSLREPTQLPAAEESGPSRTAEPIPQRPWDRPGYDALWDISYGRPLEQTRPLGDVTLGSPASNGNRSWPGAIVAEDPDAAPKDRSQVPPPGGLLDEPEPLWDEQPQVEIDEPEPQVGPEHLSPSSDGNDPPAAKATSDGQPESNRERDPHATESKAKDRPGKSDRLRKSLWT